MTDTPDAEPYRDTYWDLPLRERLVQHAHNAGATRKSGEPWVVDNSVPLRVDHVHLALDLAKAIDHIDRLERLEYHVLGVLEAVGRADA